MKKTIFISLLLIFSSQIIAEDTLIYSNFKKIGWENFKGDPVLSDSAGARIATTIQMKTEKVNFWTGVTTFSSWSVMDVGKSWVKSEYKDDYTLNHEQLHFDISELIARRLQLYINQQKINGSHMPKATKIFNEHLETLSKLQGEYDKETAGGNNKIEQAKWDDRIRKELKDLQNQSSTKSKTI